jgi:hypothetical protein
MARTTIFITLGWCGLNYVLILAGVGIPKFIAVLGLFILLMTLVSALRADICDRD